MAYKFSSFDSNDDSLKFSESFERFPSFKGKNL